MTIENLVHPKDGFYEPFGGNATEWCRKTRVIVQSIVEVIENLPREERHPVLVQAAFLVLENKIENTVRFDENQRKAKLVAKTVELEDSTSR